MRVRTGIFSVASGALAISTGVAPVGAQVAQPSQLKEVVVTGIRASLDRALDTKREAAGFVDAINAEDVGKLPDQNVAEALQRVTGVSIQRSRGEGDFVSIRGLGPNFVRGTVNNRTLVSATESRDATRSGGLESSTGRETNFDILPAEMIASIEVLKSSSASDVEGGIGGVVNIKTQRPLTLGTSATASAKGTYRDFNDKFDPSASGLASWANDSKTFGVLGAVSYSKRTIREDDADSFGYATFGPTVDTDGNGTGDRAGLSFPFSFNPRSFEETRKRLTLQGTLQWELPDQSNLVVDTMYSDRDVSNTGLLSFLGTCCGFQGAFDDVTNPDRSIRVPGIQLDGNSAVGFPVKSQISNNTDVQDLEDRLYSVGANYGKALGDWNFGLDASYSKAKGTLDFRRVSLLTNDVVPFIVSTSHDQLQLTMQPGGPDLANPASYRTNNADVVERTNDDDEFGGALDITRKLPDGGFFSALELGVHYSERDIDRADRTTFNVNTDQVSVAGLGRDAFIRFNDGDFANGTSSYPLGALLFGDWGRQTALLKANNPNASFASSFSAPQSFQINEKTSAGYVQMDIATSLGRIPLKGNVGVRFVRTDTTTTGFFQPFRIDNDPNNNNLGKVVILDPNIATTDIKNDYDNVLPSLNLSAQLTSDLFLRFAAGRSVTRPTFLQMAPGLSGINPTQRFANSGNPKLEAYESTNLDLGLEWYFGAGNALYASVFRKDIDKFIGIATNFNVDAFGVNFRSLSQPVNQGDADITGEEIGIQQTFDIGFGYLLNATFIDSKANFTSGSNAGKAIPFEGVSRRSYNATAFYEKRGFSTRLSFSDRSSYVLLSSDVFGNKLVASPYGQLDGSVSYTYEDRWTIFANAINLTGEVAKIYSDTPIQRLSYSYVGRRFEIGLKAKF
jgi:TonB-dependent receptor